MSTRIVLLNPAQPDDRQITLLDAELGYVFLPSLFRLLFAHAEIGAAIAPSDRTMHSAGSLRVLASDARTRTGALRTLLQNHPLAHLRPEVQPWLEAVCMWLDECMAAFAPDARHALQLALQDENPVREAESHTESELRNFRDLFAEQWDDLCEAGQRERFDVVDECLLFPTACMNFGDWRAWTDTFGLTLIPWPYFRRLGPEPSEVEPCAEFLQHQSGSEDDADPYAMALEDVTAEFDAASIAPFEAVYATRFRSQLIGRTENRFGLFDPASMRCLCEPRFDELIWPELECDPVLLAREGDLWGFLGSDGVLRQSCRYARPSRWLRDGREDFRRGWAVRDSERMGWVDAQGATAVPCAYDEVTPQDALGAYAVRRGAKWGLLAHGGAAWLPCAFDAVRLLCLGPDARAPGEYECDVASCWPDVPLAQWLGDTPTDGTLVLIEVRDSSGLRVLDQTAREVIPAGFIEFNVACCGSAHEGRWLEVRDAHGRCGIWDVRARRLALACEHDHAFILSAPLAKSALLLVARGDHENVGGLRFRVLDIAGEPVLEGEYAWLTADDCNGSAEWLLNDYFSARRELAEALTGGRAVRALRVEPGTRRLVCVRPAKADQALDAALAAEFARTAAPAVASQLAALYAGDEDSPADPARRLHWLKLARDAAHAQPPSPQDELDKHRVNGQAILGYALGLYHLDGSAKARREARANIELFLSRHAPIASGSQLGLCGAVLIDASAGKPELPRGIELLSQAADAHHDPEAAFVLGRCYLFGNGVPRDAARARSLLAQAESAGDRRALVDLVAALVVLESRKDASAETRAALKRELEYYRQKRDEPDTTMAEYEPQLREPPRFSALMPRVMAALWGWMN